MNWQTYLAVLTIINAIILGSLVFVITRRQADAVYAEVK